MNQSYCYVANKWSINSYSPSYKTRALHKIIPLFKLLDK